MKIISQFDVSSWSHNCKCAKCDSELEADSTDVRHTHSERDGVHPASENYHVECPVCQNNIYLSVKSIPVAVQIDAQKRAVRASSSYLD